MKQHPALLLISIFLSYALSAKAFTLSDCYHTDHRHSPKILLHPSNNGLPAKATLRERVETYLKGNASLFELPANLSNLQLESVQESLLGSHYHYRQMINGIPVENGAITVSITGAGEIYRVLNNTYPQRHSQKVLTGRIAPESALDLAWSHLRVHGKLRIQPRASLVYVPEGDDFHLIYKTLTNVNAPNGAWEHRIDAETGDILTVKDLRVTDGRSFRSAKAAPRPSFNDYTGVVISRQDALAALNTAEAAQATVQTGPGIASTVNGTALVFEPDPRTALQSDSLVNTSSAASFDPAYVSRPLRGITLNAGIYSLAGPYVTITDFESPYTTPSTTTTGNWTSKRGVNAFNDTMVYFHIDRCQRYIQSLGYTNIQNRSMPADTDGFNGQANAAFDPSANNITFGHGTEAPSPEDADVIIHEYGHSVEFAINNNWGNGGDTGAMGEGFSDYWAGSYHYATTNGATFHPTWTGHWFGNSGTSPLRQMDRLTVQYDSNTTYYAHEDIGGGIQSDELWSTPLFQSFLTLVGQGRTKEEVDRIMIEAHFGVTGSETMREMATAIVATAQRLFPNGPHADVLYNQFASHSILTAPSLITPTVTYPNTGDIFTTGMAVRVQWNPHNATNIATAALEYKTGIDTTNFFDNVESGVNGWTVSHAAGTVDWVRTSGQSHSTIMSWMADDSLALSDQYLISPSLILSSNCVMSVWHYYDLELEGDGGLIEISTNGTGGPWMDLGSRMTQNGYNDMILSPENLLYGYDAFTGNSGGFMETLINLADFSNRTVRIRFRTSTDNGNYYGGTAWWVDDITIASASPWNTIGIAPAGTSSRIWTLPLIPGSNCLVRAKLSASGFNDSGWNVSGPFTISVDSDKDGIPDAWEYRYSSSLTNMTATSDRDSDGSSDRVEYLAGTSPTNVLAALKVTTWSNAPSGGFVVQWTAESNRFYSIESTTNLMGVFSGIASNLPATPPTNQYTDNTSTTGVIRLYRVRVE